MKQVSILRQWQRVFVGALLGLLAAPAALAYPAHYIVVNEAADGRISIISNQLVELSGTPDFGAQPPQPTRLDSRLDAMVHAKVSGKP